MTTKNMSKSDSLQLRLFGDFLEKESFELRGLG